MVEADGSASLDKSMTLEKTLGVVRSHAWLIGLCVVIVAGSAYGFSQLQERKYTASVKLLFRSPGLDQQAAGVPATTTRDPQRDTATNVTLVKLGGVAEKTAQAVGGRTTAQGILDRVEVTSEGATDIATVKATAEDPTQAAQIGNAFTEQFIANRRKIDQSRVLAARELVVRQIAELVPRERSGVFGQSLAERSESLRILASLQTGNAELVERARAPSSASSPQVLRNTVLGALLGLLLGVGVAFLNARLDRRIREPDDLSGVFGLPLLGLVPESRAYSSAVPFSLNGSRNGNGNGNGNGKHSGGGSLPAHEEEAFRMLRAHLRYFNVDRDVRTVLVTSAASGEGKSTVTRYLAQAAAMMGTRTLLIEADLRRPSLAGRLGVDRGSGLVDVLIGATTAAAAVAPVEVATGVNGSTRTAQLDVLLVGAIPPNPAELIESHAMEELMTWAADHYELVLIDTPPLTVVSDAIPLLRKVDGVVIVSRLGESTQDAAEQMRDRLKSLGAPMLGVVGNAYSERKQDGYGYGYAQEGAAR
ncbi:MAG: polysaccharide biosynthesis tyrosine autokinase [Solirubrobacterales bacterium]|nr:polysaccharide biosynthesis tyrosine autokinase [Solirubrobacterales bacterium]